MKNRILTFVSVLAFLIVATSGTAFAYFSKSTSEIDNAIGTGSVQIEIVEPGYNPEIKNDSASKDPIVKNTGSVPCWVRVRVVYNPEFVSGFGGVSKTDKWDDVIKPDTFIYYNEVLNPGESTSKLFTSVKFNSESLESLKDENGNIPEYKLPLLNVGIYAEAVNAEAGKTAKEAFQKVTAK